MKKEPNIVTMIRRYKKLYARLDRVIAASNGKPLGGKDGELFDTVMNLEESILGEYGIPFTRANQKILWGDDIRAVMAGLQQAKREWDDRPVKDHLLYFLHCRAEGEVNTHDMLRILGYCFDDYNIYLFEEHLMRTTDPARVDSLLWEMTAARDRLRDIGLLRAYGITRERDAYDRLQGKGLAHLDDFLMHHGRFDLPEEKMNEEQRWKQVMYYNDQGDCRAAVKCLDRIIARDPKDARAFFHRGLMHDRMGMEKKALADYTRAIEADRTYPDPLVNRGMLRAQQGLMDEALEDFAAAIDADFACTAAFINRGNVHAYSENQEQAVADFTMALWLGGDMPNIYCNRGLSFYRMGLAKAAYTDLAIAAMMGSTPGKRAMEELFGEAGEMLENTQEITEN